MDEQAVRALAERCISGQATVYEFAEALSELTDRQVVEVMFGECADPITARQQLKSALHAARSPEAVRRRRSGLDW
jgi:hypothetical protein